MRKIISIAVEAAYDFEVAPYMYAVCDDGTVWCRCLAGDNAFEEWSKCLFPPIPQDPDTEEWRGTRLVSYGHGHGHVRPRADGAVARCGGPAICSACATELAQSQKYRMDHE